MFMCIPLVLNYSYKLHMAPGMYIFQSSNSSEQLCFLSQNDNNYAVTGTPLIKPTNVTTLNTLGSDFNYCG